ncbi:hypothetical protein FA422_32425, partial [Pseudomonas aeruginosa]|nr:hypothetical protein [Pseudomonas aeruginosa]
TLMRSSAASDVYKRQPQCIKCAAEVKRPHWSRGAACCRAAVFPGRRRESIKGGWRRKALSAGFVLLKLLRILVGSHSKLGKGYR